MFKLKIYIQKFKRKIFQKYKKILNNLEVIKLNNKLK